MVLRVELGERSYDIRIERGLLSQVDAYLPRSGKTLILTDSGVPSEYAAAVAARASDPTVVTIPQGEESKCFDSYKMLCSTLLEKGFTRRDCVVAVGGGVVGDLAGFAASTYMRGIDFYNIPTTLLSQVDSSIGGKTAIDLCGIKNIIGSFYQPKAVLIDPDVLHTLDARQYASGMVEALKMAATCDRDLFEQIEKGVDDDTICDTIYRALRIKAEVVARDERENGLRRVLNFGHTLGHGIECLGGRYHGECVALGMLCMCSEKVYPRLRAALRALGLPTEIISDADRILDAVSHDKKKAGESISAIFVDEIGTYRIREVTLETLRECLRRVTESGGEQ